MNRRRNILLVSLLALLVVAGLSFGLVTAYAQGQEELPALTPSELLARVAEAAADHDGLSVSGEFTVTNGLLGPLSNLLSGGAMGGMGGADAGLAGILQGGSGRLWVQDEKVRVDVLGDLGGDTSLYVVDRTVSIYAASENTLTEYKLPACPSDEVHGAAGHGLPADFDPQTAIATALEKMAPTASVEVTGQESVAGRAGYLLTLTPESDRSLLASVRVAVDGDTYLPLRLEVFSRGATEAVFTMGFTKISYDTIDADIFTVPSPAGVEVETKELTCPLDAETTTERLPGETGAPADFLEQLGGLEALSIEEAEAEAGFDLLAPRSGAPADSFQSAYVIELPAEMALPEDSGLDLPVEPGLDLLGGLSGPVVVLVYGQGFETVALVETPLPPAQAAALQGLFAQVPLLGQTSVDDDPGFTLTTALVSMLAWQQDGVGLIAVGGVPVSDLESLAEHVR